MGRGMPRCDPSQKPKCRIFLKALDLLKLMLDCRHIDMAIVKQIAAYWIYEDDRPKSFNTDYQKLFKERPPK